MAMEASWVLYMAIWPYYEAIMVHIWPYMTLYGSNRAPWPYIRVLVEPYGPVYGPGRVYMALYMVQDGSIWPCLRVPGTIWPCLRVPGTIWPCLLGPGWPYGPVYWVLDGRMALCTAL